jgi:hypothetical protein
MLTTPGQKSRQPSLLLRLFSSSDDDEKSTALVLILGNPSGVRVTTMTSFFATIGVRSSIFVLSSPTRAFVAKFWKLLVVNAAPSFLLGLPPAREDNKDDVVEDAMVEGVRELRMRSSRGMSRDHMVVLFSLPLSLSRASFIARARCVTFEIYSLIFWQVSF